MRTLQFIPRARSHHLAFPSSPINVPMVFWPHLMMIFPSHQRCDFTGGLRVKGSLRVVNTDTGAVDTILFEAEGTLGNSAVAHMEENGSFVLELRMITGFDHTETRAVLWTAPNTGRGKGGYARRVCVSPVSSVGDTLVT